MYIPHYIHKSIQILSPSHARLLKLGNCMYLTALTDLKTLLSTILPQIIYKIYSLSAYLKLHIRKTHEISFI